MTSRNWTVLFEVNKRGNYINVKTLCKAINFFNPIMHFYKIISKF